MSSWRFTRLYDRFDDNGKVRRNRFWGSQKPGMGEVNRRVAGAGEAASSCENVNHGACLMPLNTEGWREDWFAVFLRALLYDWGVISVFSERRFATSHPVRLYGEGSGWKREDFKVVLLWFHMAWCGCPRTRRISLPLISSFLPSRSCYPIGHHCLCLFISMGTEDRGLCLFLVVLVPFPLSFFSMFWTGQVVCLGVILFSFSISAERISALLLCWKFKNMVFFSSLDTNLSFRISTARFLGLLMIDVLHMELIAN